ncbi:MAG: hypothetical protein EXR69_14790, partial [Myxococcales bacterium]|nr:hypothetical protein [Myxococcales bacterium]
MSHEIRTPLNGVIGLAELLDDVPMSTDKRLVFDNMRRSARLLADLVSQVLDVAVADAGALKLAAEPLSIREALATVQAVFQRAAGERGLSFVAEVDAAVPERVMGDVVRIRQVLLNVLGNAMKFTESGAFHLRVSLRDRSPDRQ